ncbi:NAD(P)H-hydrate dehydratase, partial [bacterium]|nr:NAD(P)H-hydrate dehydratase [bacterium]
RELDRMAIEGCNIPGLILMENAGAGCAGIVMDRLEAAADLGVCVVAGTGQNGGDGFVVARHLWNNGFDVEVYIIGSGDKIGGDAAINRDIVHGIGITVSEVTSREDFEILEQDLDHAGLIVDALFGTGLAREVKGIHRDVIEAMNRSSAPKVSVDIPSGLDADTGHPLGAAVFATVTATFGFAKIGHFTHPGFLHCGEVYVVDISLPPFLDEDMSVAAWLAEPADFKSVFLPREPDAHKGNFGHALVVGGAPGLTGAAAMSALAALRAGAGLVTLAVPEPLSLAMEAKTLEVMTHALPGAGNGGLAAKSAGPIIELLKSRAVLAIGPGMGTGTEQEKLIAELLPRVAVPVVVDADGLNNLAGQTELLERCQSEIVLTPHPGEMARLTGKSVGDVMADRVGVAREFAQKRQAWVVLKGARTVIAAPDGRVWINTTGNPGLAKAGSGDVLTGVITGFLSRGVPVAEAVVGGVFLHGYAADLARDRLEESALVASDLLDEFPNALKRAADLPEGDIVSRWEREDDDYFDAPESDEE